MTRIFLTIIILLFILVSKSQNISLANEKMNIFYKGVDNPISFAAEGISNKDVDLKTKNGIIDNKYGYNIFRSDSIGRAEITICRKVGSKLKKIGSTTFRVKKLPDPITKVGPSSGGRINTSVLKAQQYIRDDMQNFDIDVRPQVDSFTICISRNDPCYYRELHNVGGKFDDNVIQALSELRDGDTVIFKNFFGKNVYGELTEFNSVTFFCY
jgi:hypothetical protein